VTQATPIQQPNRLQALLADKLGMNKPNPIPAPEAKHTLTVQMPANVHELTKALAINLAVDHPVLIEMLFERMGVQVSASLDALVQARRAQQHLDRLKEAYGSTITTARHQLDAILGESVAGAI
jgi:hypothetical protein